MYPSFWIVGIVLGLPDGGSSYLLGKVCIWPDLVVKRGMLARGLDAVGKNCLIHHLLHLEWSRMGNSWRGLKCGGCHVKERRIEIQDSCEVRRGHANKVDEEAWKKERKV